MIEAIGNKKTEIRALSKITADLYQFGIATCEAKGIPLHWLRLAGVRSEELAADGFVICRDSWRVKYRRWFHPEAAPKKYRQLVVLAWGTPRVWIEAPTPDDLREIFGSWRAPKTQSRSKQAQDSFDQPRILIGAYTCFLQHDFDKQRICKRGCASGVPYSYCWQYQITPAPLPEGGIQDWLL